MGVQGYEFAPTQFSRNWLDMVARTSGFEVRGSYPAVRTRRIETAKEPQTSKAEVCATPLDSWSEPLKSKTDRP